jgi:hypothetical protein
MPQHWFYTRTARWVTAGAILAALAGALMVGVAIGAMVF